LSGLLVCQLGHVDHQSGVDGRISGLLDILVDLIGLGDGLLQTVGAAAKVLILVLWMRLSDDT
jgi:hypothetical protein